MSLSYLFQNKSIFSSAQSVSRVQLCSPWIAAHQASLSITNSRAFSDSCPLSWWYYPTISSSVVPFSSCLQSFPASGSFPMSQFFASGGQSIGASASVLPKNIQDWFPLGWTGWSPCSPRDSQESSPTPQFKNINSSAFRFLYTPTLTSIYDHWKNHIFFIILFYFWTLQYCIGFAIYWNESAIALMRRNFVGKLMSLLFNMLSMLVIVFLPRSKCLLISWLQFPCSVILDPKKIQPVTVSIVSPSLCHEVMGPDSMILVLWILNFKPTFSLSFHFLQETL